MLFSTPLHAKTNQTSTLMALLTPLSFTHDYPKAMNCPIPTEKGP